MSQGGGTRQKDDPFPGSQNVTKLSPVLAWDSSVVLAGLFNITESDTNVCFALDSNVAVTECKFVMPSSSSVASSSSTASSSSAEPESCSSAESSSSVTPPSSSSVKPWSSSSNTPPSSSSVKPRSSSSVTPQSSSSSTSVSTSSSVSESSSSTTIVNHVPAGAEIRVALVGRTLEIYAPEMGAKVVRIFDMQGNLLASSSFAGASYRIGLEGLARGTPLVVRLESHNRAKNFILR